MSNVFLPSDVASIKKCLGNRRYSACKEERQRLDNIARPLGVVTTVVSAGEAIDDFSNGHIGKGIEHTVDTFMGVIGMTEIGAPVALVYFGVKALGHLFKWW